MKHIVLGDSAELRALRPPEALARLRAACIHDASEFFGSSSLVTVPCTACGGAETASAFAKNGFEFRECLSCHSLFASPRPSAAQLQRFYEESAAVTERVKYFLEASHDARGVVADSRADWLAQILGRVRGRPGPYVDFGTLYPEIVAAARTLAGITTVHCVETPPGVEERLLQLGALTALPLEGTAVAVTAFEQLEHQFDPLSFLRRAARLLRDDGVLLLTTRSASGFDLQALWDDAPSIFVPEHLNLLSLAGLESLCERAGLHVAELSTPGQLDVAIVQDAMAEGVQVPRVVRALVSGREPGDLEDLQMFLQRNRLSSHVRIAARPRGR